MIFYIAAVLILLSVFFLLKRKWMYIWAKALFFLNLLLIIAILVLSGSGYRILSQTKNTVRRVAIAAVDVSASTGVQIKKFNKMANNLWKDYNLEVIPFSDRVNGAQAAGSTSLAGSLKRILDYLNQKYRDDNIAGLTVISDGNETIDLKALNAGLGIIGSYPHNSVFLEQKTSGANFDKSVVFTKVPRFVSRFSEERIEFSVSVAGGSLDAVPVELRLNGRTIGSVYVHLKNGYGEGNLNLIMKDKGMGLLEAFIAVDSREKITENNTDHSIIEGVVRGFRVLHISGHPSVDSAFVRRGLQNIPGVDIISFYILRGRGQLNQVSETEMSLIPFPTKQLFENELDNFDLIIINDFRFSKFLSTSHINNIVKFVESGGGLLLMGGPESFKAEDYVASRFRDILPFEPLSGLNWKQEKYSIRPEEISILTSLHGLKQNSKIIFSGFNPVIPDRDTSVFFRTSSGEALIIGRSAGRGRVPAVLTDSLWRLSYTGGMQNEEALRAMIRYTLGISSMPVKISGGQVFFDKNLNIQKNKNIRASLRFLNTDGTLCKEEIIGAGETYKIRGSDPFLINVEIKRNGNVIGRYRLVNYPEKSMDEKTVQPAGKDFLKKFSVDGGGVFITSSVPDLEAALSRVGMKDPVSISGGKKEMKPLYTDNRILVFFLYLSVLSFYLKSRYSEAV